MADPAQGVETLSADLDETCELGWIEHTAICLSLRVKLDEAAALARVELGAARDQLMSFIDELEDQHEAEPGKHVNDNAYWRLKTNAEFVLSKL